MNDARGTLQSRAKSRAVERSSAVRCWQTRAVDASDDPGLGTSLYTLANMEGFCRLHLHSSPPFRRPPTNILSIIVGLRPIIVVHWQIIVGLRHKHCRPPSFFCRLPTIAKKISCGLWDSGPENDKWEIKHLKASKRGYLSWKYERKNQSC